MDVVGTPAAEDVTDLLAGDERGDLPTNVARGDPDDETEGAAEDDQDFREAARALLSPAAGGAQLLDQDGHTLVHYGAVAGATPMVSAGMSAAAASGSSQTFTSPLGEQGEPHRFRVSTVRVGERVQTLVLAESLQRVDDAVGRVTKLLLIAGPALLGFTALAAYWLACAAVRPIQRMTTDAQEIGIDRLNERVAVPRSRDETHRLAVTLNAMLRRIETGVLEKRHLLADASHELRTPLAIMRNEVDVTLAGGELSPAAREVLCSAREEVDRMTRTVDNLLTSAQAEEGRLELLTVPVDLRQLVDHAVRPFQSLAAAKGVSLRARGGGWQVLADPPRLTLVLTNLVDNAIKFSPAGETVRIDTWRNDAGEVGVTVTDAGPGISESDREHLFERFYRADSPFAAHHGGSGLGLAICQKVSRAHGGRIWVDRPANGGSAFSVALPSWRSLRAEMPTRGTRDEGRGTLGPRR